MLDSVSAAQAQQTNVYTVGGKARRPTAEPEAHCYVRAPYGALATPAGYPVPTLSQLRNKDLLRCP